MNDLNIEGSSAWFARPFASNQLPSILHRASILGPTSSTALPNIALQGSRVLFRYSQMEFHTPFNDAHDATMHPIHRSNLNSVLTKENYALISNSRAEDEEQLRHNGEVKPVVRKRGSSILKNSPSRTLTEPMNSSTPLTAVQSRANRSGRPNRVMFSPTNEILRYEVDGPEPPETSSDGQAAGFASGILNNTTAPYVLSMYLQLFFNVILASVILYLIYTFITTIRTDTRHKLELATTDALRQISTCSREFYRNKCAASNRAPALEVACSEWEKCMNRDPEKIGKSLVTAQTFGEIVNEFLKPISWKSIIICNILIFGAFISTNVFLGSFRRGVSVKRLESLKEINLLNERLRDAEKEITLLRQTNTDLRKQIPTYYSQHELDLINDSVGYSPLVAKMKRGL